MFRLFWVTDFSMIWTWPPEVHRCNEGSSFFCEFGLCGVHLPTKMVVKSKGGHSLPNSWVCQDHPRSTLLLVQTCLLTCVFFHCSAAGQWICVAVHRGACGGKSCLCSYQQFGSIDRREDGHAGRWWRGCVYQCGPRHQLSAVQYRAVTPLIWVITPVIQFFMPFLKDKNSIFVSSVWWKLIFRRILLWEMTTSTCWSWPLVNFQDESLYVSHLYIYIYTYSPQN